MIRTIAAALALSALIAIAGPAEAAGSGGGADMGSVAPSGPSPEEIQDAYNDGVAFIAAGEFKKAAAKFGYVTDAMPKFTDAWNYLGYASRKAGNLKRSETAYKKALKLDPNHPRANEYYGELLLELNRIPEADERLGVLKACCATSPVTSELEGLIADAKAGKATIRNKPSLGY